MARKMTRTTLSSRKVTLSVAPQRRFLIRKIHVLAHRTGKSVSDQVWDLCERGLESEEKPLTQVSKVPLPAADLGGVLVEDREELYADILAGRF